MKTYFIRYVDLDGQQKEIRVNAERMSEAIEKARLYNDIYEFIFVCEEAQLKEDKQHQHQFNA